jgi:uncharacterized membrane protein YeaQ/YmgE (transglycosylase-associated protein family)
MVINIILWMLFGALIGWIASILIKRDVEMATLANIIVGMAGAVIGGFLMDMSGAPGISGVDISSLIVAVVGALLLLFAIGSLNPA